MMKKNNDAEIAMLKMDIEGRLDKEKQLGTLLAQIHRRDNVLLSAY
jgi:hypothetical protein